MSSKKTITYGAKAHKVLKERADGWSNSFTGLGTTRDKTTYSEFVAKSRISDEEADLLYAEDDVASRICDTMPEHALRQGFEVEISPDSDADADDLDAMSAELKELETAVTARLKTLKVVSKTVDALVWSNVFGGSAVILGIDDGAEGDSLAEPLNEDNIKSFTHLNVIDKRYLTPLKWYGDPISEKFGTPETYLITPFATAAVTVSVAQMRGMQGVHEVHESRLVLTNGIRTSIKRRQNQDGWEDSLLNRVSTALKQFGVSWDTLAHIITDANQGVFKMAGLIDALAADEANLIQTRMELLDMSRSALRSVVLDAEGEEFSRQNFSWAGIEKPFELLMYRLSLAARVPVSILMGRSPAGLNATGESDFRSFYGQVEAYQEFQVAPFLERIVRLLLLSKDGPTAGREPENWKIEFPSLWTMTPTEKADYRLKTSQADKNWVETGVLLAEEVAMSRFGPNGFSIETSIDLNARMMPEEVEEEPMPSTTPMPEEELEQ